MRELPARASAKLYALAAVADDADALAGSTAATVKNVETQIHRLLQAVDSEADETRVATLRSDIETQEAELKRQREILTARQDRRATERALVTRLRQWLQTLPANRTLDDAEAPLIERGTTVESIRTEVARLRVEIEAVKRAPLTADELKARASEWVAERATRGRPVIRSELGRLDIQFQRSSRPLVPGDARGLAMPTESLVWLHRAALEAALHAEIDALDLARGISAAERPSRLSALRVAMLAAERIEEALIEGTTIARRPDADPRAILNVKFVGATAMAA